MTTLNQVEDVRCSFFFLPVETNNKKMAAQKMRTYYLFATFCLYLDIFTMNTRCVKFFFFFYIEHIVVRFNKIGISIKNLFITFSLIERATIATMVVLIALPFGGRIKRYFHFLFIFLRLFGSLCAHNLIAIKITKIARWCIARSEQRNSYPFLVEH